MTKGAIKMRDFRAKQTDEEAAKRKAKDNEATKKALDSETDERREQRLANNREYKDKIKATETKEEADAKKAKESAQRKARRHAAKAAKMATQTQVQDEFQRIQTPPKALLVSKGGNPSLGSDLDEDLSDYEKLRMKNIQERKQKFQDRFGTNDPLGGEPSAQNPKSTTNLESSEDEKANKIAKLEATLASYEDELVKINFKFDQFVNDTLLDQRNKKNIKWHREHMFDDVLIGPSWTKGIEFQDQIIKQHDGDVAMIFMEDKNPDLSAIFGTKSTRRLNMRSSSAQWDDCDFTDQF